MDLSMKITIKSGDFSIFKYTITDSHVVY